MTLHKYVTDVEHPSIDQINVDEVNIITNDL